MTVRRLGLLTLLASSTLVAVGALNAASLEGGSVQLGASRGVEYYLGNLELHLPVAREADSLSVELKADGLAGFHTYNNDNTRLVQNLDLGWFRTTSLVDWTAGFRQQAYKRRRHTDPVLEAELAFGLCYSTPAWDAVLRAGAVGDQREESSDQGPLVECETSTRLLLEEWALATNSQLRFDQPGDRRNEQARLQIEAGTHSTVHAGDDLRISLQHEQEDVYADLESTSIERRRNQGGELENRLWTRPLKELELAFTLSGWKRRQIRDAQDASLTGRDTKYDDQGIDLALDGQWHSGILVTDLRFAITRSRQDSRYGDSMSSRNLTRIQVNEMQLHTRLQGMCDTLSFTAETQMRRRDSDFERLSTLSDEDYSDLGKHQLALHYGKEVGHWAGLGANLSWGLTRESHLQSERSGNNYREYSLLAAVPHRLRLPWRVTLSGRNSLRTSWRVYDHDNDESPRSYIQRRWQWLEHADWRLPGTGAWRRDLQLRSRWLEEDGGSYRKSDGRELLSDSADELDLDLTFAVSRGGWTAGPGFRWYRRRDFRWELEEGERERNLLRRLYRRGPLLALACHRSGLKLDGDLSWEVVGDNGTYHNDFRVDLRLFYTF